MSNEKKMVMLAAHVPEESALHKAVMKERQETGQPVAGIIRDALTRRYRIAVKGNGKEANSED